MTENNDSYNGLHFPSMEDKEPTFYTQTDSGEYVPFEQKQEQPPLEQEEQEPNEKKDTMLKFDGQPHDPYEYLLDVDPNGPEAQQALAELGEVNSLSRKI